MEKIKIIVLACLFYGIVLSMAQATSYEGEFLTEFPLESSHRYLQQYIDSYDMNYASVNIAIKCKAFIHFGEPAFLTVAKWTLKDINLSSAYLYLKKWDKKIYYSEIPIHLLKTIKITNLVPVIYVGEIDNDKWLKTPVLLRRDVGVIGQSGDKWSFNIPGSPHWNKTFIYRGYGVYSLVSPNDENYFDHESAKQIFKKGMQFLMKDFHNIKFDLGQIEKWYDKKLKDEERKKQIATAASAEAFLNDESNMETLAEYDRRKKAKVKQMKGEKALASLLKKYEAEKKRFTGLKNKPKKTHANALTQANYKEAVRRITERFNSHYQNIHHDRKNYEKNVRYTFLENSPCVLEIKMESDVNIKKVNALGNIGPASHNENVTAHFGKDIKKIMWENSTAGVTFTFKSPIVSSIWHSARNVSKKKEVRDKRNANRNKRYKSRNFNIGIEFVGGKGTTNTHSWKEETEWTKAFYNDFLFVHSYCKESLK